MPGRQAANMLSELDGAADRTPAGSKLGQQGLEHGPLRVAAQQARATARPVRDPLPVAHQPEVFGIELQPVVWRVSELETRRCGKATSLESSRRRSVGFLDGWARIILS